MGCFALPHDAKTTAFSWASPLAGRGRGAAAAGPRAATKITADLLICRRRSPLLHQRMWRLLPRLSASLHPNSTSARGLSVRCFASQMDQARRAAMDAAATALSSVRREELIGGVGGEKKTQPPSSPLTPFETPPSLHPQQRNRPTTISIEAAAEKHQQKLQYRPRSSARCRRTST